MRILVCVGRGTKCSHQETSFCSVAQALSEALGLQRVRGVIFASGLQREVFTAGNDIKELYAPQTSIARHAPAPLAMLSSHAAYCMTILHTLSETKFLPVLHS